MQVSYLDPDDRFFFFLNRITSVISVLLGEINLTISPDSTGETVSVGSETVGVISLSTTEISEITRLKIRSSGSLTLSQTSPGFYGLKYKSSENTVGKGEIARNEQFLLFPQCFLSFWRFSPIFIKT